MYEIINAEDYKKESVKGDLFIAIDENNKPYKYMLWQNKEFAERGVNAINNRKLSWRDTMGNDQKKKLKN